MTSPNPVKPYQDEDVPNSKVPSVSIFAFMTGSSPECTVAVNYSKIA
eukprot:CAMPEP_0168313724 /NCGR_PEP_ID=MMETSP0210-20121227/3852_1 /TAXON_ID=40633 /ORGANISM="Condylostoma magnum, Strain COL2" /LENGTH=46 /DNA_ID= /DNA_START= /DNA_END= /DNA_ORIENTATION=